MSKVYRPGPHGKPVAVLGLCFLLGGVVGCQGPESEGVPSAESTASAVTPSPQDVTKESDEPPSAAEEPVNLGEGYKSLGHFLVHENIDANPGPWVTGRAEIYVIGTGLVLLSGENLLPGQEVLQQSYSSIGTENEPLVAGVVQVREPAKGLQPERYVSLLIVIDPVTMEVKSNTEVSSADSDINFPHSFTGSNGNAVAFDISSQASDGSEVSNTFGYDALTGQRLWEKRSISRGEILGAVVLESESTTWTDNIGEPCRKWTGTDIVTGDPLYTVEAGDLAADCNNVGIYSNGNGGASSYIAEHGEYVRFYGNSEVSFDGVNGGKKRIPHEIYAADPLSNLVAGRDAGPVIEPRAINVIDTSTGEIMWTLDAKTTSDLNAAVLSLYDSQLYLETTDQHPVVDVITGETVTDDASRYPLEVVDSWIYWSDGTLEKMTS